MLETEKVLMDVANSLGDKVYGLCSGGKDSMTACYIAHQYRPLDGIITIDTTCAFFKIVDGKKIYPAWESARKFAESLGVQWILISHKDKDAYRTYCKKYGMPHPSQHGDVYHEIKWKTMVSFVRAQTKKNWDESKEIPATVCFISGVRKGESRKRGINTRIAQVDDGVKRMRFVAPIAYWKTEDVWTFVREKKFELSECYEALHISGDCACGAYAQPQEALLIKTFYPEMFEWLREIESEAKKVTSTGKNIKGWGTGITLEMSKSQCSFACSDCQIGLQNVNQKEVAIPPKDKSLGILANDL